MSVFQAATRHEKPSAAISSKGNQKLRRTSVNNRFNNLLNFHFDSLRERGFYQNQKHDNRSQQKSYRSSVKFRFANIQTKLRVSEPGDIYEQEADHVADQVMRKSVNSEVNTIYRKCSSCKEEEERMKISRKDTTSIHNSSNKFEISDANEKDTNKTLSQAGSPLDNQTKEFMESRFGVDFSNVRIHTDERAVRSARSVNALAYAIGNEVVFDKELYMPNTAQGSDDLK